MVVERRADADADWTAKRQLSSVAVAAVHLQSVWVEARWSVPGKNCPVPEQWLPFAWWGVLGLQRRPPFS